MHYYFKKKTLNSIYRVYIDWPRWVGSSSSSRVRILISKSRFESRLWYQVFELGHDVDIEYRLEFSIRFAKTWSDLVVEFVDMNCVLNFMIFFLKCCIVMQLDNANDKKIIKKKTVSFLANRSLESRDVIDSKIEILGIMTTFSIAWRFGSMTRIELEIKLISNWVTMLISSIWVRLRCWYRVFGLSQKVDIDSRPSDQSKSIEFIESIECK